MSVISADSLQMAIIEELVPGQTPATPAFDLIRLTGESLTFSPNTSESSELASGGRSRRPSTVTGNTVAGDINFELHKAAWVDLCIEGVMAEDWGECPLTGAAGGMIEAGRITVGEELKTFTIEKRFPDPATPGSYLYHRFRGCSISSMTINCTPNEKITGTFSVVGGVPELAAAPLAGATYTSAGSNPVFVAPDVTQITFGAILGVATHCWTSLTITLDSQNRGIPCIGSNGDREIALGTLTCSVTGEVYFISNDVLQAVLDNQVLGNGNVVFQDTADTPNIYRFDLFDVKAVNGSVSAGGSGQDLTIPLTLEPTPVVVCDDGANDWTASVIISEMDSEPTAVVV
jgi:hypothetical protein